MKKIIALTYIFFLLFTVGVATQIHALGSSNYVIFRANIAPLYIENESVVIQVLSIPFENNKPVGESSTVHIILTGINVQYNYSQEFSVHSGRSKTLYLPALKEGHYNIQLWAEWRGERSYKVQQDIGVTKAPIPYSLAFSDDGSYIKFTSLKLNKTGVPDPNFPFRLEIYQFTHGAGESLVTTYTNITNITIHVPDNWKTGILYVEVVDVYGWRNSATINLAEMQFQGVPVSYDYHYMQREPFASRYTYIVIFVLVGLIISIVALRWWWES